MPKKRQPTYIPSSTSTVSSSTGSITPSTDSESVNDLLSRLRREHAPKASSDRANQIAAVVSSRSVPPHLRHLLNIPETAPPPPKPGALGVRLRGTRRVPGPAAPRSWLHGSRGVERRDLSSSVHADTDGKRKGSVGGKRGSEAMGGRVRPEEFSCISSVVENGKNPPRIPSLAQIALKTLAMNWDDLVEYEQFNLATLPIGLKSDLLSYLSVYGPDAGVTINSLRTLFLRERELPGGTGSEDMAHLDLTALVGYRFTLGELKTYFLHPDPKIFDAGVRNLSISTPQPPTEKNDSRNAEDVADSWEDAAERLSSSIPRFLHPTRFPNLTHLSLSHPGPSVSWSHLLSLSLHVATLTHLSLAYWPTPSLTPHARTATVDAPGTPHAINAGGAGFYSAADDDWHEAATLLRRLSAHTYCLRFLDLEGCGAWLPALTWRAPASSSSFSPRPLTTSPTAVRGGQPGTRDEREDDRGWNQAASRAPQGPDWNGAWRLLEHVVVSQGWVPGEVDMVRQMPAGLVQCDLLGYLRDVDRRNESGIEAEDGEDNERRGELGGKDERRAPLKTTDKPREIWQWVEREKDARKVATAVRRSRAEAKGGFCRFDHGWRPPGR